MRKISLTKRMLAILMTVIMVLGITPLAVVTVIAEGTDGASADPFAELIQQVPEGFETDINPYDAQLNETFSILREEELLVTHTEGENFTSYNSVHYSFGDVANGKSYTESKDINNQEQNSYSFIKTVAFDPTGSGRKDHVAYVGLDILNYSYVAYVQNANTNEATDVIILGEPEHKGAASWIKDDNDNWKMHEFQNDVDFYNGMQNFHSVAAGDFDNDGKETIITYSVSPYDKESEGFYLQEFALNEETGALELVRSWPNGFYDYIFGSLHWRKTLIGTPIPEREHTDMIGVSLATGDFNNDAVDDLAVLAYSFGPRWQSNLEITAYAPQLTLIHGQAGDYREGGLDGGQFGGSKAAYTSILFEDSYNSSYNRGTVWSMVNPQVAVGDVDGDGCDEAVVAGYARQYFYKDSEQLDPNNNEPLKIVTSYADEDLTSSDRMPGIGVGVYGYEGKGEEDSIEIQSLKRYRDHNENSPVYNQYSQSVSQDHSLNITGHLRPKFALHTVAINGANTKEYIFLNGTLAEYSGKEGLVHAYTPEFIRESENIMNSYDVIITSTVGVLDGNMAGREQVVMAVDGDGAGAKNFMIAGENYTDTQGTDQQVVHFGNATSFALYEKIFRATGKHPYREFGASADEYQYVSTSNYVFTAVDIEKNGKQDGLVGRYVGKSYAYSAPEIIGVLQAAPYYKDLGYYGGETEYTMTRSYSDGSSSSTEVAYSIGISSVITAGSFRAELSAGYAAGWTTEFEESLEKTYSLTFTATSQNAVAMVRTPVIIYRFQILREDGTYGEDANIYDLSTGEYTRTDMTIAIPSQPVYTTVSIDEYNAYVKYYNEAIAKDSENDLYKFSGELKEITAPELTENEGDPSKYRTSWAGKLNEQADDGLAFGEMTNEAKYNMNGSLSVGFAENKTVTESLSNTSGFYFDLTIYRGGSAGVIPVEVWVGASTSYEKSFSHGTFKSTANGYESSGTVAHVGNAEGIPMENLSNYGFQWQFGTWNIDLDSRDLSGSGATRDTIPVFGYMVRQAKTVPSAPENLTVSTGDTTDAEAVKMTWDTVEGATYNVYTEVNGKYTLVASGIKTSEYTYTIPEDDPALFFNFVVTTVKNGIESVYSEKAIYYRTVLDSTGIASIGKTATQDNVDTYTITYTDGSESTFTVTNGKDGVDGIQGVPGQDGHTPVITIQDGYWYIDGVNTNQAAQGVKGDTGNGISAIEKTGTNGLVDTYTITFTNGDKTTFTVTNGKDGAAGVSVEKVEKTATEGNVDTYTITLSNGNTFEFKVTNGTNGADGKDGANGADGAKGDKGDSGADGKDGKDGKDGATPYIGENGNWWIGETDTGVRAAYDDSVAAGSGTVAEGGMQTAIVVSIAIAGLALASNVVLVILYLNQKKKSIV